MVLNLRGWRDGRIDDGTDAEMNLSTTFVTARNPALVSAAGRGASRGGDIRWADDVPMDVLHRSGTEDL